MLFRVEYTLHDLGLIEGEHIEFSESSPQPTALVIRRPPKEEEPKLKDNQCLGIVSTEEPVTEKVRPHFETFDPVHPAVAEIGRRVGSRLHDYLVRTVGVLRWRRGYTGHPNPIYNTRLLHWSDDGKDWKGVPTTLGARLEIIPPYRKLGEELLTEVKGMVSAGESEPVGRELLQEAWRQKNHLPRSALLIGMTAAEVGVKEFISKLVPSAEWLAFHAPTPPLVQMLVEYLPLLPVKATLQGLPAFIPLDILDQLKKGVTLRNKTAHAGENVKEESLSELLSAIHDLLYLLDFYAGHTWAIEEVRHETREQMTAGQSKKTK